MASESEAAPKPKRLYHQKKVLETILHGLLILCVAFVPYIYWNEPHTIALFVGCLVVVHFWVIGVKQLAAVIGLKLSNLMYSAGIVERPPIKENKSQMLKWQDQAWQLAIHVTMTAGEVYVLWDERWWNKDQMFYAWVPHPNEQYKVMKTSLKVLYILQLAIWIYTCAMHAMEPIRNRRKDYHVMYIHHIVTILLVAGSASCNYYRIGLLVLYIHDASDIFIDSMKMANYLKCEGAKGFFIVEISFCANLIAWVYFRLYLFPFYIIHSALFGSHTMAGNTPEPGNVWKYPLVETLPYYLVHNLLLVILYMMHIYWFCILCKILVKILMAGRQEASRTEYEGESSEDDDDETHKDHSSKSEHRANSEKSVTEDTSAQHSQLKRRRSTRRKE